MADVTLQTARHTADRLAGCPACGLIQRLPALDRSQRACCARCGTTIRSAAAHLRSANRTAAVALAAVILYPFAVSLPVMRIEQFGHMQDTSILEGVAQLLAHGQWIVGVIVLVCSVILPVLKLLALLTLSIGFRAMRHHHRAWTYRAVEWTGRWGMLDVLAVAVLVAAMKLGTALQVTAGPGALAFCTVVVLSLIASACFDPHAYWDESGK